MNPQLLISQFRTAFGECAPLPICVGYTSFACAEPLPAHCMMASLDKVRAGESVSFSAENVKCAGGKFYAGFAPPFASIGNFVSGREKYKKTPQDVLASIDNLKIQEADTEYLTFQRLDKIPSLDGIEGLFIFATPDILAGCWIWASFDVNQDDAVVANFTSGCGSLVANMRRENHIGGYRCFIGMLDISARPYMRPNEVAFVIPAVRLPAMLANFDNTCLAGTKSWLAVRERIS